MGLLPESIENEGQSSSPADALQLTLETSQEG